MSLHSAYRRIPVQLSLSAVLDPISASRGRRKAMCQSEANGGRRCKPNKGPRSSAATVGTSGYMPQGMSGEIRRTRRAVLREAKEQLGGLLDSVVDAAPVNSAASLVPAVDADAAGQIADAITASLKANGWPASKWRSHLLCGALAAVAHAMAASCLCMLSGGESFRSRELLSTASRVGEPVRCDSAGIGAAIRQYSSCGALVPRLLG